MELIDLLGAHGVVSWVLFVKVCGPIDVKIVSVVKDN